MKNNVNHPWKAGPLNNSRGESEQERLAKIACGEAPDAPRPLRFGKKRVTGRGSLNKKRDRTASEALANLVRHLKPPGRV